MSEIVWLHEDGLRLDDCRGLPALFVFDDRQMQAQGYGLKRITFIYETLVELGMVIRRGDTVAEVLRFAAEHEARRVVHRPTVCPKRRAILRALAGHVALRELPEPPFVSAPDRLDLKRFSRFWRHVEASALQPTGKQG